MLQLFRRLRQQLALSCLFISHDLAIVGSVSDRIGVMQSGQLCEIGPVAAILQRPAHPYTRTLVGSARNGAAGDDVINGEPPSPMNPPTGCRFRTRCPVARPKCALEVPALRRIAHDHLVACHHAEA
jgi:oligopeptide/dipeptide ABC transporter ATP-binding protein